MVDVRDDAEIADQPRVHWSAMMRWRKADREAVCGDASHPARFGVPRNNPVCHKSPAPASRAPERFSVTVLLGVHAATPAAGSAWLPANRIACVAPFDLLAICWFGNSATTLWRKYAVRYIVF